MPLLEIDKDKCIGCGGCIDACPFGALSLVDDLAVVNDKCTACGACLLACPVHALNLPERVRRKRRRILPHTAAYGFGWNSSMAGRAAFPWRCWARAESWPTSAKLRSPHACWGTMWNTLQKKPFLSEQIVFFGWMTKALPLTRTAPYASTLINLVREYKPEIFLLGCQLAWPRSGRFGSFYSLHGSHR